MWKIPVVAIAPVALFSLLLVTSCTLTDGSSVLVGTKRDPINPQSVQLYTDLPKNYEKVALLSSESRNAFASSQGLTDAAINRLKVEAAKLGANGILLNGVGNYSIGSTGVVIANPSTHTGTVVATSQVAKEATGLAIYVP